MRTIYIDEVSGELLEYTKPNDYSGTCHFYHCNNLVEGAHRCDGPARFSLSSKLGEQNYAIVMSDYWQVEFSFSINLILYLKLLE